MAGEFPVYTTATPSGRAPSVRAALDVSTGAEQIGREIAGIGGTVFNIGQAIQKQEDAAEYSELKRKVDEAGFAVFKTATGDEEADRVLWGQFEQDLAKIQSKRKNVNALLLRHVNEVMPDWKDAFDKKGLAIKRRDVKDRFELEGQNLLVRGDLKEYLTQLNIRLKLKDISQSRYDYLVANAPVDSAFAIARNLMGDTNPDTMEASFLEAQRILGEVKPSVERLDERDSLMAKASRMSGNLKDQTQDEANRRLFLSYMDEKLTLDVVRAELAAGNITTTMANFYHTALLKDKETEFSWENYGKVKDDLLRYQNGEITKDNMLDSFYKNLSGLDKGTAKQVFDEIYKSEDADDPLSDPVLRRQLTAIKELEKAGKKDEWMFFAGPIEKGETTNEFLLRNSANRLKAQNSLSDWYRKNPTATTEQKETEFDRLMKPLKQKQAKNWLEKWMELSLPMLAYRAEKYAWEKYMTKKPTHVDSLEEAEKLPVGTEFEYEGRVYRRK